MEQPINQSVITLKEWDCDKKEDTLKVAGSSLLIHAFACSLFMSLFGYFLRHRLLSFVSFDKTHSLNAPQRDVSSNNIVL